MIGSEISIRDSLIDPDRKSSGTAEFRERGDTYLYRVWLFLEGERVPYVSRVTYHLHESFQNRNLTVRWSPSNPNCKVDIWTWGVFDIMVDIEYKSGRVEKVRHPMEYDREINNPKLGLKWEEG